MIMERIFDLFFSILSLLILSPLLVAIALILKFTAEGEIFYLQERIGEGGKLFKLYKFATMLKHSPSIGSKNVTIKDDPRILPVGHFLRKTKINELPQLLNILSGQMSLIGPRPLTSDIFYSYSAEVQKNIKELRPGLSGIGSIIFRREEEIIDLGTVSVDFYYNVILPYKGSLEVWFVEHKGLYLYFLLIFITLWVVVVPNTKIVWKVFQDLPEPPIELKKLLNYVE